MRSHVRSHVEWGGGGYLHSEVQCIMGHGHMGPLLVTSGDHDWIPVQTRSLEPLTSADIWLLLVRSNASWVMVTWGPLLVMSGGQDLSRPFQNSHHNLPTFSKQCNPTPTKVGVPVGAQPFQRIEQIISNEL